MHGILLRAVPVLVAVLIGAAVPATAAQAASGCEVTYVASTGPSTFSADVRVKNLGDTLVGGYTVGFTFTAGQRIIMSWNHRVSQSGSSVTMGGTLYAPVPNGFSISLGFIGSHTGVNPPPTNWSLNGTPCTLAGP